MSVTAVGRIPGRGVGTKIHVIKFGVRGALVLGRKLEPSSLLKCAVAKAHFNPLLAFLRRPPNPTAGNAPRNPRRCWRFHILTIPHRRAPLCPEREKIPVIEGRKRDLPGNKCPKLQIFEIPSALKRHSIQLRSPANAGPNASPLAKSARDPTSSISSTPSIPLPNIPLPIPPLLPGRRGPGRGGFVAGQPENAKIIGPFHSTISHHDELGAAVTHFDGKIFPG